MVLVFASGRESSDRRGRARQLLKTGLGPLLDCWAKELWAAVIINRVSLHHYTKPVLDLWSCFLNERPFVFF
ncbi:hypothetical protein AWB74_08190 [Caballeronia arvi]|uniref:Uncharacterized protein n=1 Tax=Caballeronia arvi TaxID=1777135 RepID=A0A158L2Q1_9BURK|nr:hypothetical protein [Caballeronia arvi]SAL87622.1 hypothetical protein AWB74_08190 [Caballeronia arvi]